MSSADRKRLVDPELRSLLNAVPTVQFSTDALPALRSAAPEYARDNVDLGETVVTVHRINSPDDANGPEVWFYRPHGVDEALPCLLHIHGGGFVIGDAAHLTPIHRRLSAPLRCCIASVNYRLAPETRYPGQVEDCYAALAWLVREASHLGVDATCIGVSGESAGGGLAAALALLVRDRGEYCLKFQHLIYPMLDDRTCVDPTPHAYAGEYIWTPGNNVFGWSSILGRPPGAVDVPIYAAPARAADLEGLPKTFLAVGALDLFIDENMEYGRRLIRAGVPVELHVYPGGFHAFDISPAAAVAIQMRQDSLNALARAMAR